MNRRYQPPLPSAVEVMDLVRDLPTFLAQNIEATLAGVERSCLDRYLLILDAVEQRGLYNCSLLDLGCANGFFAYLFALSSCSQVTAVDDARGASFGYDGEAFLAPLRRAKEEFALNHLEIVDDPIDAFLESSANRTWDVVLCLSVLHHFYTGYGDNSEIGYLSEHARSKVFEAIGRATSSVLYLEIDQQRVPEDFLSIFKEVAGFMGCRTIGSSASAVGDPRSVFELWK